MSIPTKERMAMFTLNNITKNEELNYLVSSHPCPNCGTTETIEIAPEKLYAYNQGAYCQDVLSGYDAGTRERFISGMCNDCFCTMNNFAMFDDE
jgi:hypothetical protein